jgi:hypothetical protein
MNIKIEVVKHMAEQLKQLFPGHNYIVLSVWPESLPELQILDNSTYSVATALMQELGIGDRDKEVFDADEKIGSVAFTKLTGVVDGLKVSVYPTELPPSCRRETYVEKVPKTQTVDTGDFIEITKTKIVCGHGN